MTTHVALLAITFGAILVLGALVLAPSGAAADPELASRARVPLVARDGRVPTPTPTHTPTRTPTPSPTPTATPAPAGSGVVTGTLSFADGYPLIAEYRVGLYPESGIGAALFVANVGPDGSFAFTGNPAGVYQLRIAGKTVYNGMDGLNHCPNRLASYYPPTIVAREGQTVSANLVLRCGL